MLIVVIINITGSESTRIGCAACAMPLLSVTTGLTIGFALEVDAVTLLSVP